MLNKIELFFSFFVLAVTCEASKLSLRAFTRHFNLCFTYLSVIYKTRVNIVANLTHESELYSATRNSVPFCIFSLEHDVTKKHNPVPAPFHIQKELRLW